MCWQVRSQLNALRRKAAYRAAKRAAAAAAAAPAVECDSPRHGAGPAVQHSWAAEPAQAQAAAAATSHSADGPSAQHDAPHQHAVAQQTKEPGRARTEQRTVNGAVPDPAHPGRHTVHSQHHYQLAQQPQAAAQPAAQSAAQADAQTAAWLDDLWADQQRDFAETVGAAGAAMREQQDWLLHNHYESDWCGFKHKNKMFIEDALQHHEGMHANGALQRKHCFDDALQRKQQRAACSI